MNYRKGAPMRMSRESVIFKISTMVAVPVVGKIGFAFSPAPWRSKTVASNSFKDSLSFRSVVQLGVAGG